MTAAPPRSCTTGGGVQRSGWPRRILGSEALAEQVVLGVFVGVWRDPEALNVCGGSVAARLLGSVHREAVDARRPGDARHPSVGAARECAPDPSDGDDVAADGPGGTVHGRAGSGRVGTAFRSLPAAQRDALRLALLDGHTQREVAVLTGTPLDTVRKQMVAAIRRLVGALPGAAPDACSPS